MIRILVLPTVDPDPNIEGDLRGIPLADLEQFVEEAKAMQMEAMDAVVKITVHGKDLRATALSSPVKRRGIGNNK